MSIEESSLIGRERETRKEKREKVEGRGVSQIPTECRKGLETCDPKVISRLRLDAGCSQQQSSYFHVIGFVYY